MKTLFIRLIIVWSFALGSYVMAEQTSFGLTPEETYALKTDQSDIILFIDVRDPVEIQFTGFTDLVDVNIPFLLVDRYQWSEERNRFHLPRNEYFIALVDKALVERNLTREARIITMCRSGSARGEPSAAYLREQGFSNAYFVMHGFQGDPLKDGPQAGMRLKNGWQNSGLPWSNQVNGEKIFRATRE